MSTGEAPILRIACGGVMFELGGRHGGEFPPLRSPSARACRSADGGPPRTRWKNSKVLNLAPRASTMPDFGSESCVGIVGMSFLRSVQNWTYGQQPSCPFQRALRRVGQVPSPPRGRDQAQHDPNVPFQNVFFLRSRRNVKLWTHRVSHADMWITANCFKPPRRSRSPAFSVQPLLGLKSPSDSCRPQSPHVRPP